jgi:hypothetical protein
MRFARVATDFVDDAGRAVAQGFATTIETEAAG